ncbi:glycosyltransferase [Metallosphaera cuprina]|uniref:Glycosyl transferase family protein n=1 Tax=Metallosphaera cuprina (strain Ar-4) TaxID=1006006 RepID=F4G2J1_METCR|nr:glycosyltransferase [Metallosphaera cuprina]AEB95039.1 glycosyl transferase family protein [Metallosphaera cuprina Ar-4]
MISVIVGEYVKRGYLKYALNSVFNQTLDKSLYEVIVVKKEEDREVDDYARKNGVKIIYDDSKKQGEFLYKGIEKSKGDIITFLDDDDMYDENRLRIVYNAFKERRIGGFKNQQILIDKLGNKIKEEELKKNVLLNSKTYNYRKNYPDIFNNSSSIALRRDIIGDDLKSVELSVDTYYAIASICNQNYEGYYLSKEKLTIYRFHTLNSLTLSQRTLRYARYIHDFDLFLNKFKDCSKEVRKRIETVRLNFKLLYYGYYLLSNGKSPDIDFTLDEKLELLTMSSGGSFKSRLARKIAGFVLFLPRPIRDRIIVYGARFF